MVDNDFHEYDTSELCQYAPAAVILTLGSDSGLFQDRSVKFGISKWIAVNLEIDLIPKHLPT